MSIQPIISNLYSKTNMETAAPKIADKYQADYRAASKNDSVEIPVEAYEAQLEEGKITATSGKDTLGISKGRKNNTYVIYFSDSAMVSRAISKGYITVNGLKIDLSEEAKEKLMETDKQAEAQRMKAYNQYIMQHDMAVARQQSETYKRMTENISRAFEIAAKISQGDKVSSSDEQELMEISPQLYAMAKSAAMLEEQQEKQKTVKVKKAENKSKTNNTQETEWSNFEWKHYEVDMEVSIESEAAIQNVSIGETTIN